MCDERLILLLTTVFSVFVCTSCFNVDTEFPIIYEDPSSSNTARGSYFGFSILLQKTGFDGKPWIQIGAPRGNSSVLKIIEPGIVFRCPIKGRCTEVVMERSVNKFFESQISVTDFKQHAWLGGSMDSETEDGGRFVVCGHRWINRFYEIDNKEYYMAGVCYLAYTQQELPLQSTTKLLPTIDKQNILFKIPNTGKVYYYANAQTGISVHFPEKKKDNPGMLIGTPGLLNWRGGITLYENLREVYEETSHQKRSTGEKDFVEPKVPNPYKNRELLSFDYLGYQVNSGRFFTETELYYVASSPRGAEYKGYVIIFQLPEVNENTFWNTTQRKEGLSIGEYFGASLAVGDINGDGLDDLVVGAPLFSQKGDEGRICVYMGSKLNRLVEPWVGHRIEGVVEGGRFGTALAALGDLDQDGYADIAVGAPYEENNRGAIYIFNGASDGLKPTYSQRIKASDVDLSLRGFGINIARPADIDENMYADVAVGSYLSGHAVLFRTHPVVTLHLDVWSNTTQLQLNDTYVFLSMCQWYTGKHAPDYINVTRIITVDDRYKRVHESDNTHKNVVSLKLNNSTCEHRKIFIKPDKNNNKDIEIKVSQELINDTSIKSNTWVHKDQVRGNDRFCKNCPVMREAASMKTLQIPYALECDDNICSSDVHLECNLMHVRKNLSLSTAYVIGSESVVQLQMLFSVDGDPAYATNVEVSLPRGVSLLNISQECDERREENTTIVSCSVNNPLRSENKKRFTLFLDMSAVSLLLLDTGESPILQLQPKVKSISNERNDNDNNCTLTFKLTTEADITISGKSEKEIYSYINLDKNHTKSVIEFEHTYQVEKIGASPVQEVEISFFLPEEWQDGDEYINFLSLYKPLAYQNNQPLTCIYNRQYAWHTEENPQPPQLMVPLETAEEGRKVKREAVSNDVTLRIKHNIVQEGLVPPLEPKVSQYHPPTNRTLYLNCTTKNVICNTVKCSSTEFVHPSTFARLQLKMLLNITALEPMMKKKDIIYFSTEGHVKIINPKIIQHISNKWPDNTTVSSTFIGNVTEEEIDTWIIILSIIAGILLFLLLVMGFVKLGFFQRKKKDELKALKECDALDEFHVNSRKSALEQNSNEN